MELKDLLSIIFSAVAVVVSLINMAVFYRADLYKNHKAGDHKHNDTITEIDKILMDDPRLWSIYDSHYINNLIEEDDIMFKAKKDAFFYYLLNRFDLIHADRNNKNGQEQWQIWKASVEGIIADSVRLTELIEMSINLGTFSKSYTFFLKNTLISARKIKEIRMHRKQQVNF